MRSHNAARNRMRASASSSEALPEIDGELSWLMERIQLGVGQAVLGMMALPRYKGQSMADISHLVVEPLLRDRLAIALARLDTEECGVPRAIGMAIWATVSDEVDKKIHEQISGWAFPTRLNSEDWGSGEKVWLLDLVASNRNLATAVLASFRQLAGDRPAAMHPIVARSVDSDVFEKMLVDQGERP